MPLPVVMQDSFIERTNKINADIEKGKASLVQAIPHLIKSRALCDKADALFEAGKVSHVNNNGSLIEVFERRIEPDGTRVERYTRIQEGQHE